MDNSFLLTANQALFLHCKTTVPKFTYTPTRREFDCTGTSKITKLSVHNFTIYYDGNENTQ